MTPDFFERLKGNKGDGETSPLVPSAL